MRQDGSADVLDQRHAALALALLPFSAGALESHTLTWCHDGAGVASYRVYAGHQPQFAGMNQVLQVFEPGRAFAAVDALPDDVWYFAVTAVGPNAAESGPSNVSAEGTGITSLCPPGAVTNVVITPVSNPPPSAFTSADIGAVGVAGSTTVANGVYTVKASGADIWNTADEFRFVYQPMTGDGTITARVDSLTPIDEWTKAGVMIRETLAPSSRYAFTVVSGGEGADFQYRSATGGASAPFGAADRVTRAPYWVRLRRAGNVFTAFISPNGTTWTQVGAPQTIAMTPAAFVGLAFTSHNDAQLGTTVFSSVQ